ncbi:glycosyltransferase [Roseococcus sp. SYP-B2431]|uniref:WecB/TagA/CpsF family glycosyltransferase n=1 Tax=Roseococcus sp. SYP-B2431 TaxID=2496640 RepID=UPI00103B72C5|nr:WecB/TagA/CpsF family glycosyltransferase [Roseococcus sp. SYP-B2431]TCH99796.1 glycosyltransferase [Roseococcus sp. SYP-B2431]
MRAPPPDIDMLGVIGLSPIGAEAAAALVASRPAEAPFEYVVTANAQHLVLMARPGNALRPAYEAAWLRVNDGQVPRLLARWATGARFALATGSDMTVLLLRRHITAEDHVTIIGGSPDLPDALRRHYAVRHIHLHDPPMGYMDQPRAVAEAIRFVREHPARFVFVTTGAPRSEQLLMRLKQEGGLTGTGLAFGSALRFAVGQVPRAPAWMRASGLEWLFRLLSEPRRLWRRYAVESAPVFLLAWRAWRGAR